MFEAGKSICTKAVMDRMVLMINHVVAAEPVAVGRLMPHAGKSIRFRFDGWPSLLPALPNTLFTVTPAGLVDWRADDGATVTEDLTVSIDASNPALAAFRAFTGAKPDITIAGDAAFAGDVNWLVDNLRWDIEDDVAKLIGDGPAHELARFAAAVNAALKMAAEKVRGFGRPGDRGPSAEGRTWAEPMTGRDRSGWPTTDDLDGKGGPPVP